MPYISEIDVYGVWTGVTREISSREGCPPGWVWAEAPDAPEGTIATWQGAWVYVLPAEVEAMPLPNQIAAKVAAIDVKAEELIAAGYPATHEGQTLRIAMDDASRADLTGMATTAVAAASGSLPWPASYAQGWITKENIRIPMATPADGLLLAAQVGDYYACIRQNGRDLKDAALTAQDQAALDAVDVEAGWP